MGPASIPADDTRRELIVADTSTPGARRLALAGDVYTILVSGAQTAGRHCLIDMVAPDGGGPVPHRHDSEELFTLLDGELEFSFRGETRVVAAPASVAIPANAAHVFRNRSGRTVHMLCLCAPSGQDSFFEAVGDPINGCEAAGPAPKAAAMSEKIELIRRLAPHIGPRSGLTRADGDRSRRSPHGARGY